MRGPSPNLGVTFNGKLPGGKKPVAYADANWTTTRATSGFCILLAGAVISSGCHRQY